MAVNLPPLQDLPAVAGVQLAACAAGIRYQERDDLVLVHLAKGSQVAAVFTRNAFCAAPVSLCRQHLASGQSVRSLLINAGNANAGTGQEGLQAAQETCGLVAQQLGLNSAQVLPLSTGVIGQALPTAPFAAAMPSLVEQLSEDAWSRAAAAIMTTDTLPKGASRQLEIGGQQIKVSGIAKGAGMIRPDMATMLAFVATDAAVAADQLQALLNRVVKTSFNAITVDGDTSTNDALVLVASGGAGGDELQGDELVRLEQAVREVCEQLAQACVRDAEGATRFVTIDVADARHEDEARQVAYTVAESPLVKTALFAGDPNWGRILAAVGRSGLADLDLAQVNLFLDDVCLIRGGEPDPAYSEGRGAKVAQQHELTIRVELGRGSAQAKVWTCDYSYDYIKINAEYRT